MVYFTAYVSMYVCVLWVCVFCKGVAMKTTVDKSHTNLQHSSPKPTPTPPSIFFFGIFNLFYLFIFNFFKNYLFIYLLLHVFYLFIFFFNFSVAAVGGKLGEQTVWP